MDLRLKQYLLAGTMLTGIGALGAAAPAMAGECPTGPSVGFSTLGCSIVITLKPGNVVTIAPGPSAGQAGGTFDGVDDTLVGLINNSGGVVNNVRLVGKTDIFGFDGDGIEQNPNSTSGLQGLGLTSTTSGGKGTLYVGTDSTTGNFNLSGPLNSFSGITGAKKVGIVDFTGGLANGGSAFWSLEEKLTAASFTGTPNVPTPEPASLTILGAALAGFGLLRRRRKS
jgi:hypothetical protein